jgi:hypothetical protein
MKILPNLKLVTTFGKTKAQLIGITKAYVITQKLYFCANPQ